MVDKFINSLFALMLLIYIFCMFLTFGHAANNEKCGEGCKFSTMVFIPLSPAFYWSWELQRKD